VDTFCVLPPRPGEQWIPPPEEPNEFPHGVAALAADPFWCLGPRLPPPEVSYPLVKHLFGNRLRLVVVGVRNTNYWRFPQCERCVFTVFRDAVGSQVLKAWSRFAVQHHSLGAHSVLELDKKAGANDPPLRRYVCSPKADTIVVCSHLDMLNDVLARFGRRIGRRALPAQLQEWHYVDTSMPAWAIRHYLPATSKTDPLSMLQFDKQAQGLVVYSLRDPPHSIVLRYISRTPDPQQQFSQMLKTFSAATANIDFPVRQVGKGCLEAKFVPADDSTATSASKTLTVPSRSGDILAQSFFGPLFGLFERTPPLQ